MEKLVQTAACLVAIAVAVAAVQRAVAITRATLR